MVALLLTGCVSEALTKQELKLTNKKQEGIVLNKNYQALLKCWDDNADKISFSFQNVTSSQIYPELGMAEMYASIGMKAYYVLFELKKINSTKTIANAYGSGYLGDVYIPLWLDTLRECAKK
jgi:hypothetical protein